MVPDMTPNYLCAPKALRNLIVSVGTPSHFKLLLLLRPPRDFIVASYKMFVRWGWVRRPRQKNGVEWPPGSKAPVGLRRPLP